MVPSFARTNTIVLVNINDLSVQPITFGLHGSGGAGSGQGRSGSAGGAGAAAAKKG
jgi:hypothetical protein